MAMLVPFVNLLITILDVIWWIIVVWVIISWLLFFASHSQFRWRNRGAYHVLEQLNDIGSRFAWPFVYPFRRMLRRVNTRGIDWSPLIAMILISFLRQLIAAAAFAIMKS